MAHKRTAADYLRLLGGKVSQLELDVVTENPGVIPPTKPGEMSPEELLLLQIISENSRCETESETFFPGSITLSVRADRLPPRSPGWPVCINALAQSATASCELYIFTCTCGVPGCAGIWRGVEVLHEHALVVWLVRSLPPRRVVVFDRDQYCREILTKVTQALESHKAMGPDAYFGASNNPQSVAATLYRVGDGGTFAR
jgi:hypothetical protein